MINPPGSGHEGGLVGPVLALSSSTSEMASGVATHESRLTAIVEAHFEVLWRLLRRLGVPEADVDDAVQEVIWVLARKLIHHVAALQPEEHQ